MYKRLCKSLFSHSEFLFTIWSMEIKRHGHVKPAL